MDINKENSQIEKLAFSLSDLLTMFSLPYLKDYWPVAMGLGALTGGSAGFLSSMIKERNPEIIADARRQKFYENKIKELDNENWLNDVIATKKTLEKNNLTNEERKKIESRYIKLLERT